MVNLWIQFYVLPFLDFSYFQSSPSPGWFYQLLVVVKVLITNQLRPHLATDFGDWVVVFGSTNFGFIWLPLAVVFIHFSHSPTFRRLVFQVCYQWIRCIDLVIGLAPLDRGGQGGRGEERRGRGGALPQYPPLLERGVVVALESCFMALVLTFFGILVGFFGILVGYFDLWMGELGQIGFIWDPFEVFGSLLGFFWLVDRRMGPDWIHCGSFG